MTQREPMTRYALYFAPAPQSPLWQAGCRWLGRDPANANNLLQPSIAGVPASTLEQLTAQARRYGFHATLKAPFRLANGFSESHLLSMAEAFAQTQRSILLHDLQVLPIGDFLALRPARQHDEIGALAMRCVSYFDNLRAAPSMTEIERRRDAGLNARQESLLRRWGYPYTEEEFRFHLTLTDSLAYIGNDAAYALRKAAVDNFSSALETGTPVIDALTIFREEKPGAPFSLWRRFPFGSAVGEAALPVGGQLFFLVGASGAGKDSLLQWVERYAPPDAAIVFARRTITRAAHPSEPHEPIDSERFWQLAAAGHFSMVWQANELCYGIRRGIEAELKAGRDVVVNGSREYIPQLRRLFPQARVIWVDADIAQIRQRIEERQRESGAALLRRLDRVTRFSPANDEEVLRLDNTGPVEVAGQRLLDILTAPKHSEITAEC